MAVLSFRAQHTGAVARPLLPLWSIAVEEQFYLVFPALPLLVGTPMMVFFAFSEWRVRLEPGWAFLLLRSRMRELMGWAIFPFDPHMSVGLAGAAALVSCLGTPVVIDAGCEEGGALTTLSWRFIGQPFRRPRVARPMRARVAFAASALAIRRSRSGARPPSSP